MRRHLLAMVDRLGMLQMDSVNVLARAHYLPGFSRLGPYDTAHLDAAAWQARKRALFEYWGHEASLLPLRFQPLLRWRMQRARLGNGIGKYLADFAAGRAGYLAAVLAEVRGRGPLAAADLAEAGKASGKWWGWSDGKIAMEYFFYTGQLAVAHRRGAFERVYDLAERVFPAEILAAPTPPEADAQRALLRLAARGMGIATDTDLAKYFRMGLADARARIAELVEAGELRLVSVPGWRQPTYLAAEAKIPRRVAARALLSPFDPLLWERDRVERVFDFHYRIGLYTPAHQREHGYYVLPFLHGQRIAGRVDLKADRKTRTLHVLSAFAEPHADAGEVAEALRAELDDMARWLALDRVDIAARGELAPLLRK